MTTTSLMPEPRQRYYNNNGTVAAGCLLYTYASGTSTPKAAYTDSAGTVPHANPIVLDAKGEALIYFDGSYKVDLKTAAGVQITGYPVDNFESVDSKIATAVSESDTLLRADIAAPSGAGLVGVTGGRTQAQHNANTLHMRDYVIADGATDDTVAATAVHVAANASGATVSYSGIVSIALQANALIPVKTSVDFCNASLVILGGVAAPPSFSTFNTLFVITDDACPLQTVAGAVSAANLAEGSMFPTLGLFDGHGFAKITCGLQVPDRDKTSTMNYTQAFKVNRIGRVSHPLSADISAYAAAITVDYRKTSKRRLKLDNLSLTEGAWNNQRIFRISRCNVEINGFSVLFDAPGTVFDNICELISIDNASDISVNSFVTTGRPVSTTTGSYCLAIYGGADIYVDKMNALTGWGAVGTDDINGMHFTQSVINRIDCHSSGHNIFADDCDLHEAGMVYGWGGGILSVKNSRAYRCPVIATRQDYGGTFFGSLIVGEVEVSHSGTSTYTAVDLATNALGASTAVTAPKAIEVSNLRRIGKASGSNAELIPIAIKVLDAASVVYAPARIKVDDIACAFALWRFGMRIDTQNMEANQSTTITRILVSNCYPDAPATGASSVLTTGILDYDSIRTPTSAVRPNLKVCDSDHIGARIRNAVNVDIRMVNTNINAIVVDTASATKPTVVLDACRLLTPAAGFAAAPIGGSTSGVLGYTILRDCEIAGLFDLSLVAALQGNTIRTGANQPTLPAAVTAALAFSGWQKAGMFS